jgi:hypothetical protein
MEQYVGLGRLREGARYYSKPGSQERTATRL